MIISISGKKQSGKDTIADIIKSLIYCHIDGTELTEENFESIRHCIIHNYKVKKFAGKLKEVAAIMLGCNASDFESEEFKNSILGEEWWYYQDNSNNKFLAPYLKDFRSESENKLLLENNYALLMRMTPRTFLQRLATDAVRENFHSCSWINSTLADYNPKEFWVITDTRFENELNAIRYKEPKFFNIRVERLQSFEDWCNQYKDYVTFIKNFEHVDDKISSNGFWSLLHTSKGYFKPNEETFTTLINNLSHESETQLDHYNNLDFFIENKDTIGDLIDRVKYFMIENKLL
jgi:hypothetical protein